MDTRASGNVFDSAVALTSKLESLFVPISEDLTNIHEILAIGNPTFNHNVSSGDAVCLIS